MKKIKIILSVVILALATVACESYDDYDTDRDVIIGFSAPSTNINRVPAGGEKSATIKVFITEASNVERTFNIIQSVRNAADTTISAIENYRFDPTVTIPANEREGAINFTAIDVSLTTDPSTVILEVQTSPEAISGGKVTVAMKK